MKTIVYLGAFMFLSVFFITGCSKDEFGPVDNTPPPCTTCNIHLPYELTLETYSVANGIHISTATCMGEFTYPVIIKWYADYFHYRKLNKTDTLTSSQENKSFYQYNAMDVNTNFRLECDATMANGVMLTKSTAH